MVMIVLGEARKAMPLLMGLDKTYDGIMYLHKDVSAKDIEIECKKFVGKIIQLPPVKSRVARKEREREIYSITADIQDRNVKMKIHCEAGVYIRKLMHDIGEALGCGAHMKFLRRVAVNGFTKMVTLKELEKNPEKHLIELEKILDEINVKKVFIGENEINSIIHGTSVNLQKTKTKASKGDIVGIYKGNKIIAIGKIGKKLEINRVFKSEEGL